MLAGAYTAAPLSGGHLNPAVTLGIAVDTEVWDKVWVYLLGQMVGAMLGAVLAYLVYLAQFQANVRKEGTTEGTADEPTPTLGIFSTIPEVRNPVANLITEIIATVAPFLREHGQILVGLDVIGGMLTEINITSPTGVQHIARLENRNVAAPILDTFERLAKKLRA